MVAPVAENVVEEPAQITVEDGVSIKFGNGVTLTIDVAELVQAAVLPFKVYTVVAEGLTVMVLPLKFPGFQL